MATRSRPRPALDEGATLGEDAAARFAEDFEHVARNIAVAVKGKDDVIRLVLTCFFAEGHLLIEDVPGVGKTSIARALAASTTAHYKRIQFTPDLLPSDVYGVNVYVQGSSPHFEFRAGPVFTNILLADEINRASPKTQSALLEVMEEQRVTVEGEPHELPPPFIVLATQNPIEMEGTYPLPEAQLDRFLLRIRVGYPDAGAEREVLGSHRRGGRIDDLSPVLPVARVLEMAEEASRVYMAEPLQEYIVAVVAATRQLPEVRLGASPRGSIALLRAVRAHAAAEGRVFGVPEDVKALARSVLAHRLILEPEAELRGTDPEELVERVLAAVPVPPPTQH